MIHALYVVLGPLHALAVWYVFMCYKHFFFFVLFLLFSL